MEDSRLWLTATKEKTQFVMLIKLEEHEKDFYVHPVTVFDGEAEQDGEVEQINLIFG